jgi:chemotaxis protein methyltransferase CheR
MQARMGSRERPVGEVSRDLVFTTGDFDFIRRIVMEKTGIALADHKRELVYGRLAKRVRALELDTFADYCAHLENLEDVLHELVNAITTNLTAFFRESYHFDHLRDVVIPELLRSNADRRRIRVWSAGCSTGEEPYSIAMVLRDAVPPSMGWDVKILATDIDTNVLEKGRAGVYVDERAKDIPDSYRRRFVSRGTGANAGRIRMREELRSLITFRRLNLMDPWPMSGPFDVIFCRNVVIYFDKPTQKMLFDRYADLMRPDGHLFVGHSETLFKVSTRFSLVGRTIYRRTSDADGSAQ